MGRSLKSARSTRARFGVLGTSDAVGDVVGTLWGPCRPRSPKDLPFRCNHLRTKWGPWGRWGRYRHLLYTRARVCLFALLQDIARNLSLHAEEPLQGPQGPQIDRNPLNHLHLNRGDLCRQGPQKVPKVPNSRIRQPSPGSTWRRLCVWRPLRPTRSEGRRTNDRGSCRERSQASFAATERSRPRATAA